MRYLISTILISLYISPALANQCNEMISIAANTQMTFESEEEYNQAATEYCNEYSKDASSRKQTTFSLLTQYFSSKFGSSSANTALIASKVCGLSDASKANKKAYENYVKEVSPEALSAYISCLSFSGTGVELAMDANTVLPKEFAMSAKYLSTMGGAQTKLHFVSSDDVTCDWSGETSNISGAQVTIPANSNTSLKCNRNDYQESSFVQLIATNSPGTTPYTFKWGKYNINGESIDELKALKMQLQNSVVAFNKAECPLGWKEYEPAYGRFIRGLDMDGGIDPNRALGSNQEDSLVSHSHSMGFNGTDTHTMVVGGAAQRLAHFKDDGFGAGGKKSTDPSGSGESRPKNVALLYCERL